MKYHTRDSLKAAIDATAQAMRDERSAGWGWRSCNPMGFQGPHDIGCVGVIPGEYGLERCDECERFSDDDEARDYVQSLLNGVGLLTSVHSGALGARFAMEVFHCFRLLEADRLLRSGHIDFDASKLPEMIDV